MGRRVKSLAFAALSFCASWTAVALAQSAAASGNGAAAAAGSNPVNALWSLIGSSPVVGVLWLWAKSEREDRRDMTKQLLAIFEADGQHKATLRERLKGQDDILGKLLESVKALEARVAAKPPRPGAPGA